MALRYVAIEKEATFQGRTERWSNVYLYETTANDESSYSALVDAVVAAERPVHTSAVSFKRGRVYTTEGLNGITDGGDMFLVKELSVSGTGTNTGSGTMYREAAVLVKWPLPRKVGLLGALGRQRSLKKWIHPCGSLALDTSMNEGNAVLSTTAKSAFATYATAVATGISGSTMVAPDGTEPTTPYKVHDYLEHRQFPRGRKEID